jgi:hypothetical protein
MNNLLFFLLSMYIISAVALMIQKALGKRLSPVQGLSLLGLTVIFSLFFSSRIQPLQGLGNQPSQESLSLAESRLEAEQTATVTDFSTAQQLVNTEPESEKLRINEHQVTLFEDSAPMNFWLAWEGKIQAALIVLLSLSFMYSLKQLFNSLLFIKKSSYHKIIDFEGKSYTLLYFDHIQSPASIFIFKPYIIWSAALDQLPCEEREMILLHEIHHIRHRHSLQLLFLELLRPVFLPIFRKLRKQVILLQEFSADDAVLERSPGKKNYAALLLRLQQHGCSHPAFFHGLGSSDAHPLEQRIKRILAKGKSTPMGSSSGWSFGLFAIFLVSFTVGQVKSQSQAAINAYEIRYCLNQSTGQIIFCDDCLTEGLDCACLIEAEE